MHEFTCRSSLSMATSVLRIAAALSCCMFLLGGVNGIRDPPALFIFGDSLLDAGNNNFLFSFASADYQPYGLDRPDHVATGRFSNNRTVADVITEAMETETVLAVLDPACNGTAMLRGVNFASAGAGIHPNSGDRFGRVLTLDMQLEYFNATKAATVAILGETKGIQRISDATYFYCIGSNDYLNNYLQPDSTTKDIYDPIQWQDLLISVFRTHLQEIYALGARKIVVNNIPPVGCIPQQMAMNEANQGCIASVQKLISNFNTALKEMVQDLGAHLQGSQFIHVDNFGIAMSILQNAPRYGFEDSTSACCGGGRLNGQKTCSGMSPKLCLDRGKFVWFDGYHPTDAFNLLLARRVLYGYDPDVGPQNLKTLIGI